ncbi:Major facilitator, sugar transporter-like [Dillenia turbinata]|uniref:Major facilitator, sugar transporter-like n=1 Tax=Dillenia turbinata TaxID=194707 RepID=A0AAN8ZBU3_9MAGN
MLLSFSGFASNASLVSAVITGGVNVLATWVSVYGTDKWGRRVLLLGGGIQMLIFQICCGCVDCLEIWSFWSGDILVKVVCRIGSVVHMQSGCFRLVMGTSWVVLAEVFLTMLCHLKYALDIFFAAFVLIMTLFIYFFLPETEHSH